MCLSERAYVLGSGRLGSGLSHELDCQVHLGEWTSEMGLVDAGAGQDVDGDIGNIVGGGLDLKKLEYLLLTHAHTDHVGGCRHWKDSLRVSVYG